MLVRRSAGFILLLFIVAATLFGLRRRIFQGHEPDGAIDDNRRHRRHRQRQHDDRPDCRQRRVLLDRSVIQPGKRHGHGRQFSDVDEQRFDDPCGHRRHQPVGRHRQRQWHGRCRVPESRNVHISLLGSSHNDRNGDCAVTDIRTTSHPMTSAAPRSSRAKNVYVRKLN